MLSKTEQQVLETLSKYNGRANITKTARKAKAVLKLAEKNIVKITGSTKGHYEHGELGGKYWIPGHYVAELA